MSAIRIHLPREAIAEFCRRNGVRRLSIFGLAIRDDFTPPSDVDVLVEFEPGRTPGFALFGLQEELTDLIGRSVDLNTSGGLSRYFRDEVLKEAEPVDVAA